MRSRGVLTAYGTVLPYTHACFAAMAFDASQSAKWSAFFGVVQRRERRVPR